jgi:hypothetical protein
MPAKRATWLLFETINAREPNEIPKTSITAKRTPGYPLEQGGIVSLIELAANLDDSLYRRARGILSTMLEEVKSINATHALWMVA